MRDSRQDPFVRKLLKHIPHAFLLKVCGVARGPFEVFPPIADKSLYTHIPLQEHILCIFDTIFDWCVDPRLKTYKPFTLTSSRLFHILEEIISDPRNTATLVFVPSGVLRDNWLFLSHQACLLFHALRRSADAGELDTVLKHYSAFKNHTSSPRAVKIYKTISEQLPRTSRTNLKNSIDLILRGHNLASYLNASYEETAGCASYVEYIKQLDGSSPLVPTPSRVDKKHEMDISDGIASTILRDLCYGRTVAQDSRVKHGFEDSTHNACCLLGPKTRAGADATGNPIGKLSESVTASEPFLAASAMKPWTTCMGSAVCSSYGQKYGDAYMKFAASPDKKTLFLPPHGTQLSPACEHYLQEEVFGGGKHRTPGINEVEDGDSGCSERERNNILANIMKI